MILLAAQRQPNDQIAASLSVLCQIVGKWRKRFFEERLAGLEDEARTSRLPVTAEAAGLLGYCEFSNTL
jgi:hypothetical protein